MNTATMTRQGLRKAAIFVSGLDRLAADQVLDSMDPEQARIVRQAIMELGPVDAKEQQSVLAEFRRAAPRGAISTAPGVEVDASLAKKFASPPPVRAGNASGKGRSDPPFHLLRATDVDKLVRVLLPERPQTIALVLSHMPPEHAGNVLARLRPELQVDVVRRLVDLEETDPEILEEVERGLESRLSEQVGMQRRRVAGFSAMTGILDACPRQVGMEILDNLSVRDRQLADRLSPEQFEFNDLVEADDTLLGATLRAADEELVVLALVGAPSSWIDRFTAMLPDERARAIRHELEHLQPTRLSDVEEARRRLAELARRMAMEGRARAARRTPVPMAA